MDKIRSMYYEKMNVENMSAYNAFMEGWDACLREQERLEVLKKRFKTFNPYEYVSTDPHRLFLQGVYYKDGYSYATDGKVAFKIKSSYSIDYEKQIIDKDGLPIEGSFPVVEKVIPHTEDIEDSTLTIDDFKIARAVTNVQSRYKLKAILIDMGETDYSLFNACVIDRVIKFWSRYPAAKLYRNKRESRAWCLIDKDEDATLVFMPLCPEISICGYKYDIENKRCFKVEEAA